MSSTTSKQHFLFAVDPSLTSSGWALFAVGDGMPLAAGLLMAPGPRVPLANRLLTLQNEIEQLFGHLRMGEGDVLVCEGPAPLVLNPNSAMKVERVRGIFETASIRGPCRQNCWGLRAGRSLEIASRRRHVA